MSDELWKGAEDEAWMHVYGQYQWHAPATIRGNRRALQALRDAIDRAMKEGSGEASVFATDGEGYSVDVHCSEVLSVIGTPEYRFDLEYEAGKREAERASELRLRLSAP